MDDAYLEQIRAHVDEGGRLSHTNAVDLLAEIEALERIIGRQDVTIGKLNQSRNEWRDRYHAITRGADIVHGDDFDPVDADIDPIGDLRALLATAQKEIAELKASTITGRTLGRGVYE